MHKRAKKIANEIMTAHGRGMSINKHRIKELVNIAIHVDESLAKSGIEATFGSIVEPLNDSFDANDRDVYYDIFSYVIHIIRALPEADHIDQKLKNFGLFTQQDLLDRVKGLIDYNKTNSPQKQNIKKVFVLSRVTIGADVAITSIIIEKAKNIFPHANIFFLANKKNYELFGNDENIKILPLDYKRKGGLITRMESWLETLKHIENETKDIEPSEYVIIDSNSRITQLGLLPLVADDIGYYLFEPLAHADEEKRKLGEDVNEWLTKVFGEGDVDDITYPTLNIPAEYNKTAKEFYQKLADKNKFIATVNFGVGGNDDKRISNDFEFGVVLHLIENGATVILDEGFGEDEIERADSIINQLEERGKTIIKVNDDLSFSTTANPDLIAFKGGIGQFAALISQSQLYLGYDSMGQHVAAALEIPELVIFNGYPTEKFSRKWHPHGKGKIDIIHAEGISEKEVLKRTKKLLKS